MIKVKVEWRHTCSSCGTQLVVDYLREETPNHWCPWCGDSNESKNADKQLRKLITDSVMKLESRVNSGIHAAH